MSGWEGDPVPAHFIDDAMKFSEEAAGTGSPSQPENFAETQFSSSLVTSRTCLLSSLTHKNL